ncbi:caspase family protein [Streptomyces sp. NRRL B-3229]|uniref:wHTH domain-containing protein n=1 Tax=Streptomyces sp. NRRL B-3229 TaxID=1463836 RepID=UPI00056D895F|nr:caspase family protein [Streptomyces sp. NRRL B-3229]
MPLHKALLIGASEYDDPRIQNLPFVLDDLQRMRDALAARGFHTTDIVESRRGITPNTVNSRIRAFLREAGRGDTLLILLSGHGQHFKGKDYLIPEDASLDGEALVDACIEIGWEREIEDSGAAHVVFLIDACREGIDLDTMAPPGLRRWSQRKIADTLRRKVAYVYACTAPQLARFVRPDDVILPGPDIGIQPGESFSLFSRAVADTVAADPHTLRLQEFSARVQDRITALHRAYGKVGPAQQITVRTDTAPGAIDFPLLPGPDRPADTHPWIRSIEKHQVWHRTPEGHARQLLQQSCVVLAGRLASVYEDATRNLDNDPWYDTQLAGRTHDRLGFLVGRLGPDEFLSQTEAALALLLPLVEQTFWAQEISQRRSLLTDAGATAAPEHARFHKFAQRFPRLKRRLLTLQHEKTAAESVERIRWWLFHRWLIQQPELYAAESLKALLGDAMTGPDQPAWVADALSANRLIRLLKEHRTAPFSTRRLTDPAPRTDGPGEDDDIIAASTGDEHEVRMPLVSALIKAAYAMAVDPVDLPEIVVEHVGIHDSVDLGELLHTIRASDWRVSGMGRSLNAVCTHPAVQIALREHAGRVDELLRDINRGGEPALLSLATLPPYADGSLARLTGNAPDLLSDGIRFQLAEDRVQELLMGEQLYGEKELAVRELYQNALDAVRYRDCRTQFLKRTGRPVGPWEGRIEFVQGVGSDGRPYLECRDNGIGMGLTELTGVFSQGGARFVDLPEYIEDQAAWAELPDPKPTLHPNSRFGIGVLSYFMLADEIVVRTCRTGRDGRPGRLLQVTIAGPGNLFRVEDLGDGDEDDAGTSVRLLLARRGTAVSCVEALQRVLWVAPYRTTAVHGSRRQDWAPGELSHTALELKLNSMGSGLTGDNAVALRSGDPDLWWVEHDGVILADGLFAEVDNDNLDLETPFGTVINLSGEQAPELSVDRTSILSFDAEHVAARMADAARGLTDPELPLPHGEWLAEAGLYSVSFADCVAAQAERADLPWQLENVKLPFSQVGFFPPDANLLPLVTGRYAELDQGRHAWFLYNMPTPVLRWRLRTLYRAGLGEPVSLSDTEPSDALCARPSDLVLLRAHEFGIERWDQALEEWLRGPESTERYWLVPSRGLVETGCVSFSMLFPWRDPRTPLATADLFTLSERSGRTPTEVAERLTCLGYHAEPLQGCASARREDLLLLRPLGDLSGWLTPGARLSAAQVCLSASQASYPTPQAARRLAELGFDVPTEYPIWDDWTDDERDIVASLWRAHSVPPSPEAAQRLSLSQLASVAQQTGWPLRHIAELLAELGFALPADTVSLPELSDDDRALLGHEGELPPVDQQVSFFYLVAAARRVNRPVPDVAARLRQLGYTTDEVSGRDLPSREEMAIRVRAGLNKRGPVSLSTVATTARRAEMSMEAAVNLLTRLGYDCTASADVASRLTHRDVDVLNVSLASYPDLFAPITPPELHAATLHSGQEDEEEVAASLTSMGFEVMARTPEWERERDIERHLRRELRHPSLMPDVSLGGAPTVSLVTLAVVAVSTGRALREVALLATQMGLRHEIEDWFSPAPPGNAGSSAAATPPPSAAAPLPGC